MTGIDWGLIKVQYEIFGEDIRTLADENQISPSLIHYAAEEGDWQKVPLAEATRDWRDLDQLDAAGDQLIDEVTKRMRIMRTIKQSALSPQYIALETALLGKAMDLIKTIDPASPGAAGQLKTVSDMIVSLQEKNNGSVAIQPSGGAEGSGGITVQIMSQVGADGAKAVAGAQVKIAEAVQPVVERSEPMSLESADAIPAGAS